MERGSVGARTYESNKTNLGSLVRMLLQLPRIAEIGKEDCLDRTRSKVQSLVVSLQVYVAGVRVPSEETRSSHKAVTRLRITSGICSDRA